MEDLKIQQALGAVEGPLRALVAEAEGQGRVAGAAAEAERIWQVGKVLAGDWDGNYIPMSQPLSHAAFLTELRKRAVPGDFPPAVLFSPSVLGSQPGDPGAATPENTTRRPRSRPT